MSWQCTSWALREAPAPTSTARLVLIALADRCQPDGRSAWPTIETLALEAHTSESSVKRALKSLEECGAIRRGNQLLAQAVACSYDDDAIYGGLSRRDRHRLGAMIDKDVIVRRRDGADVDRRRRECLEWLRAHPSALAQLDDSTRYWSSEWATRKRDMAVARN